MDLKKSIREKALQVGFDVVGFATADTDSKLESDLGQYLDQGRHGDMAWMAKNTDCRASPKGLWPDVRSIIALGINYAPVDAPADALKRGDRGNISVYARGKDYHDLVKKRLKQIGRWLVETHDCEIKVFVDTAPVMEKPIAQKAGIGWQGKHTNLVSPDLGSWFFLGEIYTTLNLEPDTPTPDQCGTCTRCLDACPTDALSVPYQIDPRSCISYLTIEHKETIDEDLASAMGNRIYGCDDCLDACPWNKFSSPSLEPAFFPRVELSVPKLSDLSKLDDVGFREFFAGSPVKRTGHERFMRNVLIAIANSGDQGLVKDVRSKVDDPSTIIANTARWALSKLEKTL
ncbi:MAG: tRNA epoxyqueuosine(34) reductase QueG [Rhodospirillaceae bacterium]|nr:tRNA epoxyqueuosine(34) reductase QueG [Rhodospirillaceae bacterium]MBL6942517.1 tRNA epoxyqueuosine(34) reductase QueG [Rhodospirillales bacterium]